VCVIARVCNDLDARLSGRMLIHTLVLSGLTATDVGGFMAFGAMPGRCCFLRVTHGMLKCMIIERFVDDVSNVKAVARCDYARIVIVYKYSMN